jgi:hypothetical protein
VFSTYRAIDPHLGLPPRSYGPNDLTKTWSLRGSIFILRGLHD